MASSTRRKTSKKVKKTLNSMEDAFQRGSGNRARATLTQSSGLQARTEAQVRRDELSKTEKVDLPERRRAGRANPKVGQGPTNS